MQKYENTEIFEIISNIEKKTQKVAGILKNNDILSSEEIEIVNAIYRHRKIDLEKVDSWYNSSEGKYFIASNNKDWRERILPILEEEKNILKVFSNNVDYLKTKLKELAKQKSVLIYTKET
jgi:hypothetical protein